MSFTAKILSENALVYLVQYAESTPDAAYYYVNVSPTKQQSFLQAIQQQSTDRKLSNFGDIIASGHGQPHPSVQQTMAEKYAIESV